MDLFFVFEVLTAGPSRSAVFTHKLTVTTQTGHFPHIPAASELLESPQQQSPHVSPGANPVQATADVLKVQTIVRWFRLRYRL